MWMQQKNNASKDWFWAFWPVVPIYPYSQRRTLRQEVVSNTIWTFEQLQGIFYVVVPIRMTVIKLAQGGLLVYAPVAPTPECLRLVNELVEEHGDIKYIILPTISGVEHKVFVGPFANRFPKAQVFVAPYQWSFPVNLPLSWLGFPPDRTYILPKDSSQVPFADEFDYRILGPIYLGPGRFAEVALFHKQSQTLLLTDSIISVPTEPPAIIRLDPYPLLFHAKDSAFDLMPNNLENYRKGWQRICLFALYFRSSVLEVPPWVQVFRNALKAAEKSKKAYFGLFPFRWRENWQQSFEALRRNGEPFVAPILQTLILNRAPIETLSWANQVAQWNFNKIIPCHFDAPISATPQQFRQAFSFLEKDSAINYNFLVEQDVSFLNELEIKLEKTRLLPPAQPKI
ncbi:hypothetical protein C7H19_22945 [Aphanothece hegewaldii CCALA 016]|uniref:DUF4336 domain-containing protein n=2 Tax=Aphanothece TaxID=1121 RepID=A0A2T1LRI9_9CHRO|nr:hypothetical protein C7H19_22945 [Aphanothece hegewaldii CCALA 016]